VFGKGGLVDELKKALSERILKAGIDDHLTEESAAGESNHRNGYSSKSVLTGTSKMTLSIPRDRAGRFDPKLIAKYQRRFPDFDDKIISMYARGMTVREIRGHLEELYGIEVSPDLISTVTAAVLARIIVTGSGMADFSVPWNIAAMCIPAVLIGGQIGPRLIRQVDGDSLIRFLGWLFLVIGLLTIGEALLA
jgi:putative transposase